MSAIRLISSSPLKFNVLQDAGNRNQNLLKLTVTSASADSTAGNENNGKSALGGQAKKGGGRGRKPTKKHPLKPEKSWEKPEGLGPIQIVKHHHSVKKFQTPSVSRRNARERNRVKQVNSGFATLREHVPNLKNKTSKVDTLKAAVDYIKTLRELMGDPLDDSKIYDGPVLITELEDHPSNNTKSKQVKSETIVSSTTPGNQPTIQPVATTPTTTIMVPISTVPLNNSTLTSGLSDSSFETSTSLSLSHLENTINQSNTSMNISPPIRSGSAQSMTEMLPMVYQLPAVDGPCGTEGLNIEEFLPVTGQISPSLSHVSSTGSTSGSSSAESIHGLQVPSLDSVQPNSFSLLETGAPSSSNQFPLPDIQTLRNVDWNFVIPTTKTA